MSSRTAMIQWYLDREGKVGYTNALKQRLGPDAYDSASALFSALIAGKFLPYGVQIGTMSLLTRLIGVLLQEIDDDQVQAGDVFIAGFTADTIAKDAFTGVSLNRNEVIYCGEAIDGIGRAKVNTLQTPYVRWYRLAEPFDHRLFSRIGRRNKEISLSCIDLFK